MTWHRNNDGDLVVGNYILERVGPSYLLRHGPSGRCLGMFLFDTPIFVLETIMEKDTEYERSGQ